MQTQATPALHNMVEYDSLRRRLWILGQRCHHGATGSVVAAIACLGLMLETAQLDSRSPASARSKVVLALTGGALMAHDWKDHGIWFERGRGSQL